MSDLLQLPGQLKRLGLRTMANIFEEEALKASKTNITYVAFLSRLVE